MFSMKPLASTTSIFALYTQITAYAVLVRTVIADVQSIARQLIPQCVIDKIVAKWESLFGKVEVSSPTLVTITIDESRGYTANEMYQAAEAYLNSIITPSAHHLEIFKHGKEMTVAAKVGDPIVDIFKGVEFTWQFIKKESKKKSSSETEENRALQLCFEEIHKDFALSCYLPYVEKLKSNDEDEKVVKLYAGNYDKINLNHPSTFETLAIEPALKKMITEDLGRFLRRKEFYRSVGKVWKRGYLLYGPPGTGKSSLIAAMANYLKFDVHDMELSSISSDYDLRSNLVSISNRSIIVIEDIDCGVELENRENGDYSPGDSQISLSGLLNFVDGLWSGCGDERIIIFTTNYKERLDPALLRPGRMDMHIHLSYLSPNGFKILAYNYLKLEDHSLFGEIEGLISEMNVTPAEVAEELMRSEDADVALNGLLEFLKGKKCDLANKVEKGKALKNGKDNGSQVIEGKEDGDEMKKKWKKNSRKNEKMMKGYRRGKARKTKVVSLW